MSSKLGENNAIYEQLKARIGQDRMLHAFLFAGGSDSGRREIAFLLADELCAGHPEDCIIVDRKEGKAAIGVDEVEDLIARLAFKPYGERYAVVIPEAHLMGPAAQNKLLKTLEEPVSPAVIMLLAENRDVMLKTVLSRCSVYQLKEPALEADEETRLAAEMLLNLCAEKAPFYRKKAVLSGILGDKEKQRDRAILFVNVLEERILEASKEGNTELLYAVAPLRAARRALRQTHNTAYTLKQLCLHL